MTLGILYKVYQFFLSKCRTYGITKTSIITFLPQNRTDNILLEHVMPISLLNVDYKITAKAIANRVKKSFTKVST